MDTKNYDLKNIKGIFTICSGTSDEWGKLDPIIEDGEIGYNKTINKIKIGDGKSKWSELPFVIGELDFKNLYSKYIKIDNIVGTNSTNIQEALDEIYSFINNLTPKRIGAVNERLDTYKNFRIGSVKNLNNARLYLDVKLSNGKNESTRIGLDEIKKMNTKIITSDNLAEVDINKLTDGDYVYLNNKQGEI